MPHPTLTNTYMYTQLHTGHRNWDPGFSFKLKYYCRFCKLIYDGISSKKVKDLKLRTNTRVGEVVKSFFKESWNFEKKNIVVAVSLEIILRLNYCKLRPSTRKASFFICGNWFEQRNFYYWKTDKRFPVLEISLFFFSAIKRLDKMKK